MIETIYIEESILKHPRVASILSRFPAARTVVCERYGEIFNPKAQNFRLQKQQPALILAKKHKNFVLEAPQNYGIGANLNFYFSHMLNCLYDCRYCFLQGMYQSAHYVLFVNYEDFQNEINRICKINSNEAIHFFSGYDCDSLAMEPVTGFAAEFLPFFECLDNAWLELRTKSTQIRSLSNYKPLSRCIVAFSLAPAEIAGKVEHKAPPLERRLAAIRSLQQQGWLIGLRFDPILYQTGYRQLYRRLFEQVFEIIDVNKLHSVSLGVFRLPESYFKKIHKLYPEEKLFSSPFSQEDGMVAYTDSIRQEIMQSCTEDLLTHIPETKLFACAA